MAQRGRPPRQLLNVAVGGPDLAVGVMVVPRLSAGERVQRLADCAERDVAGEEPQGAVCSCSRYGRPDRS
jgi:hypothetical protein